MLALQILRRAKHREDTHADHQGPLDLEVIAAGVPYNNFESLVPSAPTDLRVTGTTASPWNFSLTLH